jgi:hypothetical protein
MSIRIQVQSENITSVGASISTRQAMFETNSSSSHALIVGDGKTRTPPMSREEARSGIITVGLGEYGWEWRRFYRLVNKLSYLTTDLSGGTVEGLDPEDNARQLRERSEGFAALSSVVREYTGCALEVFASDGYVDHQSAGRGAELCGDLPQLRAFLFAEGSYLETGNDNSPAPKVIPTDQSEGEHTYARLYAAPSAAGVSLTVQVNRYPGWVRFASGKTLPMYDEATKNRTINPPVLKLIEGSIITAVTWSSSNAKFVPWEHCDDVEAQLLAMISSFGPAGWRFVENLQTGVQRIKAKKDEEYLALTLTVDKKVHASLREYL